VAEKTEKKDLFSLLTSKQRDKVLEGLDGDAKADLASCIGEAICDGDTALLGTILREGNLLAVKAVVYSVLNTDNNLYFGIKQDGDCEVQTKVVRMITEILKEKGDDPDEDKIMIKIVEATFDFVDDFEDINYSLAIVEMREVVNKLVKTANCELQRALNDLLNVLPEPSAEEEDSKIVEKEK